MSLDISFVLGLGDYTINQRTQPAKERLFKHMLLDIIGSRKGTSLSAHYLQELLGTEHKLNLGDQEFFKILSQLVESDLVKLGARDPDSFIITEKGDSELHEKNLQYQARIKEFRKWFDTAVDNKEFPYDTDRVFGAFFDSLLHIASKNSELLLSLLTKGEVTGPRIMPDTDYLAMRLGEVFPKVSNVELSQLAQFLLGKFMASVAHVPILRDMFLYLAYGNCLQYFLSRGQNQDLQEFFKTVRSGISDTIILLDTNAIIALLCHADPKNFAVNSLFELASKIEQPRIRFAYIQPTITELNYLMKRLGEYAEILEMVETRDREEVLGTDGRLLLFKSPILSYLTENRYRNWDHYLSQFFESWRRAQMHYKIMDVRMLRPEDDAALTATALRNLETSESIWRRIDKTPKSARHDFLLLFYTLALRTKMATESITQNAWCFTLDRTFEEMESEILRGVPLSLSTFEELNSYLHLLKTGENHIDARQLARYAEILYGNEDTRAAMIDMHTSQKKFLEKGKPYIDKDEGRALLLDRMSYHRRQLE